MSRFHHRPANKRGWAAIRAIAIRAAGRRCTRCHRPGRLEIHHPLPLSEGGDNGQALEVICRVCHLARHHKPDPARLAWATFLQEFQDTEVI